MSPELKILSWIIDRDASRLQSHNLSASDKDEILKTYEEIDRALGKSNATAPLGTMKVDIVRYLSDVYCDLSFDNGMIVHTNQVLASWKSTYWILILHSNILSGRSLSQSQVWEHMLCYGWKNNLRGDTPWDTLGVKARERSQIESNDEGKLEVTNFVDFPQPSFYLTKQGEPFKTINEIQLLLEIEKKTLDTIANIGIVFYYDSSRTSQSFLDSFTPTRAPNFIRSITSSSTLESANVYLKLNSSGSHSPYGEEGNHPKRRIFHNKINDFLIANNITIVGFHQNVLTEAVELPKSDKKLVDLIKSTGPHRDHAVHLFLKVPDNEDEQSEEVESTEDTHDGDVINNESKCTFEEHKAKFKSKPETLLIFGAPGTGKSHFIENKIKEEFGIDIQKKFRTVFHQEYTYANFFGQFRPQTIHRSSATLPKTGEASRKDRLWKEMGSISSLQDDVRVVYSFSPGPFMKALAYAWSHPTENVALIIEELNRGNAAAIFGELFQLLDRPKSNNYSSQYPIEIDPAALDWFKSQLPAEITDKEEIQTISLPPNLHLFASMNQASQGVFPLDTAFKRRWSFRYMPLDDESANEESGFDPQNIIGTKSWQAIRKDINKALKELELKIPEDRLLGAYFLSAEELEDSEKARASIKDKVVPYLWNDVVPRRRDKIFDTSISTLDDARKSTYFGIKVLKTENTSE